MPPSSSNSSESSRLWRLSGMGTELAAGVIGMGLLGWLLDRWMHTSPWIMLGGIFVGLVGGGWNFIRRALAENKAAAERWTHDHPGGMAAIRAAKRRDKRGKGRAGAGGGAAGGAGASDAVGSGGVHGGPGANSAGATPRTRAVADDAQDPYA